MKPFLTARWTNLAIVTYAIPPKVLLPSVPPGLELDTRDGDAFVSLVAFDFEDTRVFGVPWPGYRAFPELNLRFYVRASSQRGVVFIREYAPSRLVCALARRFYNENYYWAKISRSFQEQPDSLSAGLCLTWAGEQHRIEITGRKPATIPAETGDEHFFKELRWGFGIDRHGKTIRYEVVHPPWATYRVTDYRVELDWVRVYGPEWKFLDGRAPCSVVFAAGSAVELYPKRCLE